MTRDEFFDALAVVAPRLHWNVFGPHRHLRGHDATGEVYCPLTALADVPKPILWKLAAYTLDLTLDDAEAIMRAADRAGDHDRALRARLLAACGVEEVYL